MRTPTIRRLALTASIGALGLASLTACTPEEVAAWLDWHSKDPAAAEAFANGLGQSSAPSQPQGVWDRLAECEAGGDWSINTGNGYSGGLQFKHSTWRAYGGEEFAPLAYQATRDEQIIVAERVLDDVGWGAWPTCSRRLGLR